MLNKNFWLRILVLVFGMMAICSDNSTMFSYHEGNAPKRELSEIELVEQSQDSLLCGAATIKMVENYFFSESNSLDYIFEQISTLSVQGRLNNATYKMGAYLESRGLVTSIVRFMDLKILLDYCEENQIPVIMNIQVVDNPLLGHYVVFTGYNSGADIITILDPEDNNRTMIRYNDLENSFKKISDMSEVGGNIMIIPSDRETNGVSFLCSNCNKRNTIDGYLLDAVAGLICNNCDRFISIQ